VRALAFALAFVEIVVPERLRATPGNSQTNLQEIDETHCAFQLENASTINHICVFLLGTGPSPSPAASLATCRLRLAACRLPFDNNNERPR
jgi:hypothetical protein